MGYQKIILIIILLSITSIIVPNKFGLSKTPEKIETLEIRTDKKIENCTLRGLSKKILFVGSKNCIHCVRVKPIIEKLIKENKLEKYYTEYDLSDKSKSSELNKFNVRTPFFPTLIVNCSTFIGARNEIEYKKILGEFKKELDKL